MITATCMVISGGKREVIVGQRTLQNRYQFVPRMLYIVGTFSTDATVAHKYGGRREGAEIFSRSWWGGWGFWLRWWGSSDFETLERKYVRGVMLHCADVSCLLVLQPRRQFLSLHCIFGSKTMSQLVVNEDRYSSASLLFLQSYRCVQTLCCVY